MMRFCSVASGSSGNSYIIASEKTALVLDAGVSCKRIIAGIERVGRTAGDIAAVLVTHEHSDHIRGLAALKKKLINAEIYASGGSWDGLSPELSGSEITPGELFAVGDIEVTAFPLSHDAEEPVGFSFKADGTKLAVVTDTGIITEEIFSEIKDAAFLVLEANYEEEMLLTGRYPYFLKQRIKGKYGHLSNVDAAEAIAGIFRGSERPRLNTVLLAHLSKENNHPDLAFETVRSYLSGSGIELGRDLSLGTLRRDAMSELFYVL